LNTLQNRCIEVGEEKKEIKDRKFVLKRTKGGRRLNPLMIIR